MSIKRYYTGNTPEKSDNDYPDFCDAFISSATYDGEEMSPELLEILNEDQDFVNLTVYEKLF